MSERSILIISNNVNLYLAYGVLVTKTHWIKTVWTI